MPDVFGNCWLLGDADDGSRRSCCKEFSETQVFGKMSSFGIAILNKDCEESANHLKERLHKSIYEAFVLLIICFFFLISFVICTSRLSSVV